MIQRAMNAQQAHRADRRRHGHTDAHGLQEKPRIHVKPRNALTADTRRAVHVGYLR
jgi:hypothetical protein